MNLVPAAELTGAAPSSLMSWYGSKSFATATGLGRGMTDFQGELYKVTDQTLYKIDANGVITSIGTIPGVSPCIFASDAANLIITSDGQATQLNNGVLTPISDPDFDGGNSVAYLNQQMLFDGTGGRFQVADVGDPDSIQSNSFATAESSPDDLIRVYAFKQVAYMLGTKSIDPYYNAPGVGTPPWARVNNGVMTVGLGAVHSVANTEDFMYFLGDDKRVYRVSAYQAINITSNAIAHQFDKLGVADARAFIAMIDGQSIYVINFISANRTFAFNEASSAWFELSTGAAENGYLGTDYVEIYGKRLIENGGNVLELDANTHTDNGDVIVQERVFGPISGAVVGEPGAELIMSWVDFEMELGVGTATGQGVNPQMLVSASFDGGKTYTSVDDVLMGRTGEGRFNARWHHLERFFDAYIKVRVTDPVFVSLYGGSIGLKRSGI